MTFVGKVLVVVQVFLSLCFMAFAGAVFTVQQNWKTEYEKKVTEVTQKNEQLAERDEQISFLNKDLAATQAIEEDIQTYLDGIDQFLASQTADDRVKTQLRALAERAQRAEQQASSLQGQLAQVQTQLMEEKKNYEALETANKKVVDEAKERAQEVAIVKKNYQDVNNQLAQANDENFNLKDRLFSLESDYESAANKQKSLLTKVVLLQEVIRKENINEEEALAKDEPPPFVTGKVINTRPAGREGAELVEISLGSDDGLAENHTLQVFSLNGRGKYLGEIKVVYVASDRAVGEVILKTKNGQIQRGDNVTTKL